MSPRSTPPPPMCRCPDRAPCGRRPDRESRGRRGSCRRSCRRLSPTSAFKSVRATGAATLMAGRGLNSNATTTANATAKTAMMRRARRFRLVMVTKGSTTEDTDKNRVHGKDLDAVISVYPPCSQWWSIFLGFRALEIRERQFDVAFSIVLIVLEREGDVERRFVLGEVVVALRGAPGDRAE